MWSNFLFLQKPEIFLASFTFIFFIPLFFTPYILKNKERLFLFLILFVFFFSFLFSKTKIDVNRGIVFILPFLLVFFAIYLQFMWKRDWIYKFCNIVIIGCMLFSYGRESLNIVKAQYGDAMFPYHTFWEGFYIRADYKTPYLYINQYYQEGDQVIIFSVPQYALAYLKHPVNFRVWSSGTKTIESRNVTTDTLEIQTVQQIEKNMLLSKRIWLVTSFSVLSYSKDHPRIFHLGKSILTFLEKYKVYTVYTSPDSFSEVYLIEFPVAGAPRK